MTEFERRLRSVMRANDEVGPDPAEVTERLLVRVPVQASRLRSRRSRGAILALLIVVVGAGGVMFGLPDGDHEQLPPSEGCYLQFEFSGDIYREVGKVYRIPPTAPDPVQAQTVPCEEGVGSEASRAVSLDRISGIPTNRGLLFGHRLFVPLGSAPPTEAKSWMTPPSCFTGSTAFTLHGEWTGLAGRETGTGPIPKPYQVEVLVEDASPASAAAYGRTLITLDIPVAARSLLTFEQAGTMLAQGGKLEAQVTCEGPKFQASFIRPSP